MNEIDTLDTLKIENTRLIALLEVERHVRFSSFSNKDRSIFSSKYN